MLIGVSNVRKIGASKDFQGITLGNTPNRTSIGDKLSMLELVVCVDWSI